MPIHFEQDRQQGAVPVMNISRQLVEAWAFDIAFEHGFCNSKVIYTLLVNAELSVTSAYNTVHVSGCL